YRFNRRFDLHTLAVRLLVAVARCKPRSEQVIRQAESHC
ncbi:MAG: IS1595 family transposase, partial [Pseudomonadota bacterium]|nr:IS1595 family transposase [Pseudomonadota bacterium]